MAQHVVDSAMVDEKEYAMQLLAEFGPQNIQEAFMYFKHWVKGRPMSDATCLPAHFEHPAQRSDFGRQMPHSMQNYDPDAADRQPEVYAEDRNAYNAAVAEPGEPPVPTLNDWEDAKVRDVKAFRKQLEGFDVAEKIDELENPDTEVKEDRELAHVQDIRRQELTAPIREVLPSMG